MSSPLEDAGVAVCAYAALAIITAINSAAVVTRTFRVRLRIRCSLP
jgi:hypothetical protein